MHAKTKGTILNITLGHTRFYFFLCILTCMAMTISYAYAQEQSSRPKPELVEIILDNNSPDQSAKDIIKTILNPKLKTKLTDEDFNAKFIPLQHDGSDGKFIFAVFENPDFGGCYASGCMTVIYHSPSENEWKAVFSAYVIKSYYDRASRIGKPANLIFSSKVDNSNPGIWMWNGKEYVVVNNKR